MDAIVRASQAFVQEHALWLWLVVLGFNLLFLIWLAIFSARLHRLAQKYQAFMKDTSASNVEGMLMEHLREVRYAVEKCKDLELAQKKLENNLRLCVQRVALVRFNAFAETGSDLSFAAAFLNENGDGVVITSIFGRDETRTYAKPVVRGESKYLLTNEEREAIHKALKQ